MLTGRTLATRVRLPIPWGTWYGLARSLIALGMAGTLAFSGTDTLFRPVLKLGTAPHCDGAAGIDAFCVVPHADLGIARWACVAILLVVASGWRPRFTGIPHWYVTFSVASSIAIPDGGDQVSAVLTLLLIPVTIGDPRRWHWSPASTAGVGGRLSGGLGAVAVVALVATRLQVVGVYFDSSVAKLGVPEWKDGSAMYYWLNNPSFGAPPWAQWLTGHLVDIPVTVAMLTWLPMFLEFSLALSLFFRWRTRRILLVLGVGFHLAIALLMGLWSFGLAMFGALILLLVPIGQDARAIAWVGQWVAARLERPAHSPIPAAEPAEPVADPR